MTATPADDAERIDRLLDAIDLVKEGQHEQARVLLRALIHDYNDFEDAWLWMSVAVDSLDQAEICLDNVLRVNPNNTQAAGALYRLRESEMLVEKRRGRLRFYRDFSLALMWLVAVGLLYAVLFSYMSGT
ncbi:MAG: hypothetical protein OHK0046_27520 [Anaerolineae bacterium]